MRRQLAAQPVRWVMSFVLGLVFLAGASPAAFAQKPAVREISGVVVDVDGKPVANATVAVSGGGPTATTAADGTFKLANAAATNLPAQVISLITGQKLGTFPITGNDEVWYNPGDNNFFAAGETDVPTALGIIHADPLEFHFANYRTVNGGTANGSAVPGRLKIVSGGNVFEALEIVQFHLGEAGK